MATATAPPAAGTGKKLSKGIPEKRLAWMMVSPSLLLIAAVAVYPVIYAVWLSLHQYSLLQAGVVRLGRAERTVRQLHGSAVGRPEARSGGRR